METDLDLPELIKKRDHLNVLRYIRIHQLQRPELVVSHGKALFGNDLSRNKGDELSRLAALEQVCLAALDLGDSDTAEVCLSRLRNSGIEQSSARFRLLLARCLEAGGDPSGASIIYDDLLKENQANSVALKRKYCILKAQVGKTLESAEALNTYLQQNYGDVTAWYELAQVRMELGDYKAAAFCLEEVLLATPADPKIHCELAECYATIGGSLENWAEARKHMAQALELKPDYVRAQMGLVVTANAYLQESSKNKKQADEFEDAVAQELVKYGVEKVLHSYKKKGTNSAMLGSIKALMEEYKN